MEALYRDGHVIDLILILMVAEGLLLLLVHRRTGRGPGLPDLLGNLAAGMFLMLAVRTALTDAWWGWVALALVGALASHLVDLFVRYHRQGLLPSRLTSDRGI
jgi:hypothetical protein